MNLGVIILFKKYKGVRQSGLNNSLDIEIKLTIYGKIVLAGKRLFAYVINNLIAIISLIVSIIALCKGSIN